MQPHLEGAFEEGKGFGQCDMLIGQKLDDFLLAAKDNAVGGRHDRAAPHRALDGAAVSANAFRLPVGEPIGDRVHEGCQALMLDELVFTL